MLDDRANEPSGKQGLTANLSVHLLPCPAAILGPALGPALSVPLNANPSPFVLADLYTPVAPLSSLALVLVLVHCIGPVRLRIGLKSLAVVPQAKAMCEGSGTA